MKKWLLMAAFETGLFALGRYSATDSPQSSGPISAAVESPEAYPTAAVPSASPRPIPDGFMMYRYRPGAPS